MRWLRRLRYLMRPRRRRELAEEMAFHQEMLAAEGVPAARFGNDLVLRERSRDAWGWLWAEQFAQDLKLAVRQLRRERGFAAAAVAILALGIGANTALFSVLEAVVLHPLPYEHPEQLVRIDGAAGIQIGAGTDLTNGLVGHAPAWRRQVPALAGSAAYHTGTINLSANLNRDGGHAGLPLQVDAAAVSRNFFSLLGVSLVGPGWGVGNGHAIVVSQSVAAHFNLEPGGRLRVNGDPWLVAGIAPATLGLPRGVTAWLPLPDPWRYATDPLQSRVLYFPVIGRLRPGATAATARQQIAAAPALPAGDGPKLEVTPLRQSLTGDAAAALSLLFGAVGLVLLIACANVAGLQLTRGLRRRDEWRVRAALGASRGRLARQQLAEALALTTAGGAAGVGLAAVCLPLLRGLLPAGLPLSRPPALDAELLGFALAVVAAVALGIGLLSLYGARNEVPRPRRNRRRGGLRSGLVVAEVALALVLLAGAGLMLSSLGRLAAVNPGFRAEGVLTAKLTLSGPRYSTPAARARFYQSLQARLAVLPGVRAAALGNNLPLNPGPTFTAQPATGADTDAYFTEVSPEYFATLGIPLLAGRDFTDSDRDRGPQVAIVSRSLARTLWPHGAAVGSTLDMPGGGGKILAYQVVGLVGDLRLDLDGEPTQAIYFPLSQAPTNALALIVRTAGDPGALAAPLRQAVAALDPDLPVAEVATMAKLTRRALAEPIFRSLLLGIFALLALTLSVAGLAAVVAYNTAARTHEMGVRMALGAAPRTIAGMILRGTLGITLAGLALGAVGTLFAVRLLRHFLYATSPYDAVPLAAATALLAAGCLAAGWWPARRAARLDPSAVLRHE
jgi:putative ABC transport system permease protein